MEQEKQELKKAREQLEQDKKAFDEESQRYALKSWCHVKFFRGWVG